jgi:A/G-specific adenine glycosylase
MSISKSDQAPLPTPISRPDPEPIPEPQAVNFVLPLLRWYAQHARRLPWREKDPTRGAPDPYRVWVSEIMLQQTRVETVIPYFERWMERFPSIASLAAASQQEVLAVWEGLGYYSRARSLHHAAQIVAADYAGQLPGDVHSLRKLPGIGRYTAGAIASIAFGLDQPALDGNIRRVLSRLFDVTDESPGEGGQTTTGRQRTTVRPGTTVHPRSPAGDHHLWELAEQYLPPGEAGDYNQALMDLGATLCTPRAPDCLHCPLADYCQARALGVQEQRPVVKPRPAIPHYTVTAAVITCPLTQPPDRAIARLPGCQRDEPLYLIAQRPAHGLLGGLWEFPGGKVQEGEDLPTCLRREIGEELGAEIEVGELLGVYRHAFTHFRITLHAFRCTLVRNEPRPIEHAAIRWVKAEEMERYPMGKIDRRISKDLLRFTTFS